MKHTPGPWCFGTFHRLLVVKAELQNGELIPDKHYQIADIGPGDIPFDITERSAEEYANAQLIAAAPDLLEALQALSALPEYDGTSVTSKQRLAVKQQVKAAIAKATGENNG